MSFYPTSTAALIITASSTESHSKWQSTLKIFSSLALKWLFENLAIFLFHSFIFNGMTDLLYEREKAMGSEALIFYEITDYCVGRLMVISCSMTQAWRANCPLRLLISGIEWHLSDSMIRIRCLAKMVCSFCSKRPFIQDIVMDMLWNSVPPSLDVNRKKLEQQL